MKILFVIPYPLEGPSSRYRVWQYLPYLKKAGFQFCVSSFLDSQSYHIFYKKGRLLAKIKILIKGLLKRLFLLPSVPGYDVIFIQKEAFPFGPPVYERAMKQLNKNIIFDFDDATYLPQTSEANKIFRFLKFANKTEKAIQASLLIFAGNQILADYAKQFHSNVQIIPTPINTSYYFPKKNSKNEKSFVIGWMGSRTTAIYLLEVEEALHKIKEQYGETVKIVIIGGENFRFQHLEAEYKEWKLQDELYELQHFDMGIMPLPDNQWTRGKCGFKALLYMSVGIPAICSAVGINREIISHGKNGFLIEAKTEWEPVFTQLIKNAALRTKIGKAGRQRVIDHYSLDHWAERLIHILKAF